MSAVCPAGHTSSAEDYCDVCGMPIDQAAQSASPAPPTPQAPSGTAEAGSAGLTRKVCPNCSTETGIDALFCESCGYDFTTATMPRPIAPTLGPEPSTEVSVVEWVAEVWIDPAWYEAQQSPDPLPSPGLPEVIPLLGTSLLIGRHSNSRNIHPDIDCGTDTGVSRRQTQLTTDGTRWWVEDLDSANGTFVAPAAGDLPDDPIAVGVKRELAVDDRVYVGAWTRIVIRRATGDESAPTA